MSVKRSEPLGVPMQYDPHFKVDVHLHEPLLSSHRSMNELFLEVVATCLEIELLVYKEATQNDRRSGDPSRSFETKVVVSMSNLKKTFSNIDCDITLEEYINRMGISQMCPLAYNYILSRVVHPVPQDKICLDRYCTKLAELQQVITLAHQLNGDVVTLDNHKYIAHQLALLYQSLVTLDCTELLENKKSIEGNFQLIKDWIRDEQKDSRYPPLLNREQAQWLLDVTSQIVTTITAYPQEITENWWQILQTVS